MTTHTRIRPFMAGSILSNSPTSGGAEVRQRTISTLRPLLLLTVPIALLTFAIALFGGAALAQTGRTGAAEGESDLVRLPQAQPPLDQIGPNGWGRNIRQIAVNDLNRRGMNAGLALTRSGCAYVGSRRGEQGALVLDITNPRRPTVIQEFTFFLGSSTREVRTVDDLDLLIVMQFKQPSSSAGPNILEFFDISDCRNPVLRTTLTFGAFRLHEFFVWRDPADTSRILVYVSRAPYMNVIDATNILSTPGTFPFTDFEIATFDLSDDIGGFDGNPGARLHSMSVSDDGTRAYMSDSNKGYYTVDSTPLAAAGTAAACNPDHQGVDPCLRKLNPDLLATLDPSPPDNPARLLPNTDSGGHHSLVKVPGVRATIPDQSSGAGATLVFAIAADEIGGPDACPWSWSRVLNITEDPVPAESNHAQVATLMYPENEVENCLESNRKVNLGTALQGGRFRGHNPTVLQNLVVQANYASGLRIWDISNPYIPFEVGAFFPKPVPAPNTSGDSNQISIWSYPVILDGLIYVVGINEGLLVLDYRGPRHEEIDAVNGPCEGNSSPIVSIGSLTGNCIE